MTLSNAAGATDCTKKHHLKKHYLGGSGATEGQPVLFHRLKKPRCFGCSAIGGRFAPAVIIRILSAGILAFLCIVLFTNSLPLMLAGTIGLGLSLSGMYGTTVANAGDVFGRYPLAMGIFVTLSGIGSIVTPSVIGTVAESTGIRTGMRILLAPAAVLLVVAILNRASCRQ